MALALSICNNTPEGHLLNQQRLSVEVSVVRDYAGMHWKDVPVDARAYYLRQISGRHGYGIEARKRVSPNLTRFESLCVLACVKSWKDLHPKGMHALVQRVRKVLCTDPGIFDTTKRSELSAIILKDWSIPRYDEACTESTESTNPTNS